MINDNVLIQAIIVVGSVITTYLTVKYKDTILNKASNAQQPKDRMETVLEGYEKLITQQQEDIERKALIITSLEELVGQLRRDLERTTSLLEKTRLEMREAKYTNQEVTRQLDVLKKDYTHGG